MFFRSVHNTLDHIAMVDQRILAILEGETPGSVDPKAAPYPEWQELKEARRDLDGRILALAAERDAAWLESILEIESATFGRVRRIPRGLYVAQIFNHQTHHCSQVTTELWKMGIDYGSTDIPYRPDSPF